MSRLSLFALILATAFVAGPAQSHGTLGPATAHIFLVKNPGATPGAGCEAAGWDPILDFGVKCFETLGTLTTPGTLNNKIWGSGGILPTKNNPLTVDIGPGEFLGRINCPAGQGHVTFRGAGRDHTIIKHSSNPGSPVKANECSALGFQDLKLIGDGTTPARSGFAVQWTGGGSSSWSDVDLEGEDVGWWDSGCPDAPTALPLGTHYFWGSTIRGGRIGYYAECSDSWFYGGEIAAKASISGEGFNGMAGVWVAHRGEVHTFGSAVRVSTKTLSSGSGTAYGVRVGPLGSASGSWLPNGFGEFHSHGGVISVNTFDTPAVGAIGLSLESNEVTEGAAKAHTLETAFAFEAAEGASTTRLSGTGSFESPHLWEARTDPPPAGGQIDGQEIYVETDCDEDDCTGGTEPHVMIYSTGCTAPLPSGPWFDLVRKDCRVH